MGLERTKVAVAAWDADKPRRDALWSAAMTNEAVYAAQADEKTEADKVREAFFEDTKDVNSRDHAALIHPDDPWLRRLLSKP